MNNEKNLSQLDKGTLFKIIIKYLIEGFVVGIVSFYIPALYKTSLRKPTFTEISMISLTASFAMFILDYFTYGLGLGYRFGAGFVAAQNALRFI